MFLFQSFGVGVGGCCLVVQKVNYKHDSLDAAPANWKREEN